jgi:hypothetical protein
MSVHVSIEAQRLSWKHFVKREKSPIVGKVAQTATSIQPTRIRTRTTDEGAQISEMVVQLKLDAKETWVVKGRESSALLEHERLHYRIAILLAYELETDLLAMRAPKVSDLTGASNRVLEAKAARGRAIDDAYDVETNGGCTATSSATGS